VSGTEEEILVDESEKEARVLSLQEIISLVGKLHNLLDLEVIRLTGGEPTLYRDLLPLIKGLKETGIPFIKMTSNGFLLKNKVKSFAEAGLTHLNISLDAIEPEAFYKISRRKNIQKILEGIDEAINAGVEVKINAVVMRGVNDDQILPLLNFSFERNIVIRFLELMKMGHLHNSSFEGHFYPEDEILKTIAEKFSFKKQERESSSTSNYWKTEEGNIFGIVANESEPFCHDCNRLRLDSYGNIYGCLSENKAISILDSKNVVELSEKLIEALAHKQPFRFKGSEISMLEIGG
jgi:cyclic pyranopterin phosphate synthase